MGSSGDGSFQLANYLQLALEEMTPRLLRRAWPVPVVLVEVVGCNMRVHSGSWSAAGLCSGAQRTIVARTAPLSPMYSFLQLDADYREDLARLVHVATTLIIDVHAYHVQSSLLEQARMQEQLLPTPFMLVKCGISKWAHMRQAKQRAMYTVELPTTWPGSADLSKLAGAQAVVKFPLHPTSYGTEVRMLVTGCC